MNKTALYVVYIAMRLFVLTAETYFRLRFFGDTFNGHILLGEFTTDSKWFLDKIDSLGKEA